MPAYPIGPLPLRVVWSIRVIAILIWPWLPKTLLMLILSLLILTDSAADEPHSHGFVSFMVKVKTGTPIGTVIHNTAAIYFDYNSAVVTNTATNEVTSPLGVRNMKCGIQRITPVCLSRADGCDLSTRRQRDYQ